MECTLAHGLRARERAPGIARRSISPVPRSRELLQPLTDIDLSEAAFPFLGVREGHVAGVAARVLRVGLRSALGYEIHVPYRQAHRVWDALMNAGAGAGPRAFGVEAQRVLRLEKGHAIVAQDTDA